MLLSLCFTIQQTHVFNTKGSNFDPTDLLLGEASLGGDLVDLLLLQLQLGARVAHLKEAAAEG